MYLANFLSILSLLLFNSISKISKYAMRSAQTSLLIYFVLKVGKLIVDQHPDATIIRWIILENRIELTFGIPLKFHEAFSGFMLEDRS